jgi:Coenzyme PQQ synthesis protein D (PqqD)
MIEETTVLRRNPRVEYRSMGEGEGGVLLHLDTAAYHGLNEVGAAIWRLLEEPKPFDVLLRELRGELQEVPSRFEDEIRQFLSELAERDLILIASPV